MGISVDVTDLHFFVKDSNDFTLTKINKATFIDQIFEFKEDVDDESNEDEYFSKQNCKLLGPSCKECDKYLSNYEDLDIVFQPHSGC